MVDKVALGQVFSEYFSSDLSVSFHQCPMFIIIYTLFFPEGQKGRSVRLPQSNDLSEIEKHFIEKHFNFFVFKRISADMGGSSFNYTLSSVAHFISNLLN